MALAVADIVAEYRAGASQSELARKHGVTGSTISKLLARCDARLSPDEIRNRHAAGIARKWADPEFRQKRSSEVARAQMLFWCPEMDAVLRDGLIIGLSLKAVAELVGVCSSTAARRADLLGLARNRRRGRRAA